MNSNRVFYAGFVAFGAAMIFKGFRDLLGSGLTFFSGLDVVAGTAVIASVAYRTWNPEKALEQPTLPLAVLMAVLSVLFWLVLLVSPLL